MPDSKFALEQEELSSVKKTKFITNDNFEEVFMIYILALPGFLIGLIPAAISMILCIAVCRLVFKAIQRITQNIELYFETRYTPKVVHVQLAESEIKRKYRELDIKEHGYNPMRHDFAMIELFPKKPVVQEIVASAKNLFPNRYHQLMPTEKKDEYKTAHGLLLNMLVERHLQISSGQWSADKERLWQAVPYLPKAMIDIDDEYINWLFTALGREKPLALAS